MEPSPSSKPSIPHKNNEIFVFIAELVVTIVMIMELLALGLGARRNRLEKN
jgi:hypothetical protein